MKMFLGLFIASVLFFQMAQASEVENIEANIKTLGFDRFYTDLRKDKNKEQVKIAIFDYGFDGYQGEKGITIPKSTILKQRPGDTNFRAPEDKNTHGLAMAQILTQYMTKNYNLWSFAPQIYLYKSDGYSNFQWAINDAIANNVDIILHSIVIEYGSNYDGRGFYNALVNKATNSGIVWVNASGNFGLTTYNTNVATDQNGWVEIEDLEENALPVKCKLPKNTKNKNSSPKKCNVRLVLAWDDFKNKPLQGSVKDLDLYLLDSNFESTVTSQMTQVEFDNKNSNKSGFTLYPREIIETQIPEGISYIKVKAKSANFTSSDKMRITADGEYVSFPIRDEQESLLNPADNANVITVGEDSSRSSLSLSLNKPELVAPSLVKGDDGRKYKGSSNAAAVVAAGIGLMKKINPDLDREAILNLASQNGRGPEEILNYPTQNNFHRMSPAPYLQDDSPSELNASFIQSDQLVIDQEYEESARQPRRPRPSAEGGIVTVGLNPYAIPLKVFEFAPANGLGCFPLADIKVVEPCMVANFIIQSRSLLVATTSGLKIATSFDPIKLIPRDTRLDIRDVIAIFPVEGFPFRRVPRNVPLPPGAIEIFKLPIDEAICKLPDWDFLMTELEVSRRRIYEANATGAYNNYIPQSCGAEAIVNTRFPMSNWSMYPVLQQSPYTAPVGPAPIGSGYRNNNGYGYSSERSSRPQSGENFQMPRASEVENNEYYQE